MRCHPYNINNLWFWVACVTVTLLSDQFTKSCFIFLNSSMNLIRFSGYSCGSLSRRCLLIVISFPIPTLLLAFIIQIMSLIRSPMYTFPSYSDSIKDSYVTYYYDYITMMVIMRSSHEKRYFKTVILQKNMHKTIMKQIWSFSTFLHSFIK